MRTHARVHLAGRAITVTRVDYYDVDECAPQPCKYGATCNNLQKEYSCKCTPGWQGKNCDQDINECAPAPCKNGATCTNLQNAYSCTCSTGWQGINCDQDINECAPNPCKNGATCNNLQNEYSCKCTPGWQGKNCDKENPKYPQLILRNQMLNIVLCKDLGFNHTELLYKDIAINLTITAVLKERLIEKVILKYGRRAEVTIDKEFFKHPVIGNGQAIPWNITASGNSPASGNITASGNIIVRVDLAAFYITISEKMSLTVFRSHRNKELSNMGKIGNIMSDARKVEIDPTYSKVGTLVTSTRRHPVTLVQADKQGKCWKGDF